MENKRDFVYDFQPEDEHIILIGIPDVESSERKDISKLIDKYKKSIFNVFSYISSSFPTKYKTGLHIYMGEYGDHLWVGFNHPSSALSSKFLKYLETELPEEYFIIEESLSPMIPMVYSYYPNKIISFDTYHGNGEKYADEKYGTMLEVTAGELFPDDMKSLL